MTSQTDGPNQALLDGPADTRVRDGERPKFFTDAVVAIAMTLLILPLLESVSDAAREGASTTEFLSDHGSQVQSFLISFVVIASFWMNHHQAYEHVRGFTGGLMWVNVAWMLTIVWLPVATAMTALHTDRAQVAVYVGTMLATALIQVVVAVTVRRHPQVWEPDNPPTAGGFAADLATAALFATAFVIGVAIPGGSYLPLFLLWLTPFLQRVLAKRVGSPATAPG